MSIVIAQNEYILQLINEVETLSGKKLSDLISKILMFANVLVVEI